MGTSKKTKSQPSKKVVESIKKDEESALDRIPAVGTSKLGRLKNANKGAIMGIGHLLVVVSIAYSTAVVLIGVDSIESKIALVPQATFGLFILFKAFSKLYK